MIQLGNLIVMKINSAQLEAFFAVAKLLNFTKAASLLGVTQSALSQRIAKLEEELDTSLFIRDRSSIRLTEAGEQVLRYCQLHESNESELLMKLKGSKDDLAGVLRMGGFSSVTRSLLLPALKKIMAQNPRLSIQLITEEISELRSLLNSSRVDYILTNRKSESPDIESIFLGYEDNVLVKLKASPDTDVYLDHDESNPTTSGYFSQNKISFRPSKFRYLGDVYGMIEGVRNGFGMAVLPLHLIEKESQFVIQDLKRVLRVPVYLQFFAQPYYRRLHSVLLQDLQDYFQQRLKQKGSA